MKNKIQNFITDKSLFNKEDKLILGISAGASTPEEFNNLIEQMEKGEL